MKRVVFGFFAVLFVGCGTTESPSTNKPAAPTAPSANVPAPSPPSARTGFKSPDELAAAYKAAFERGDKAAIESMVYWAEIPADHRDWTLRAILNTAYADGVHGKIPMIEVADPIPGVWKPEAHSLPPVKMISGTYEGEGGGTLRIPVGEKDGLFYVSPRYPVSMKP
jgi:hypothetical protein